jgi:prolyl oligopeptidase
VQKKDGQWIKENLATPGLGTVNAWGVDPEHSDAYWLSVTDFLTPASLYLGDLNSGKQDQLKSEPGFFKTEGLRIQQREATSKDGTKVPYFLVAKSELTLNGENPTLLYGYGGFEISMLSSYRALTGIGWLEQGGVYVLANIRGGGEFGPRWHQAALKENRQLAYDDFIAIAEDLIERKITSPQHLGIRGGSNGGLLMGNMLVQRPDLFKAIVCQVPLLDMYRYNKLLAGASWMGEYGNPDIPEEWAYLQKYSPYQRVKPGVKYPRTLFTTSTRDDRVHPGHARKMVAKMKDQGHDVLYYENIEGGHGGASDNPQKAFVEALIHTFLWNELK